MALTEEEGKMLMALADAEIKRSTQINTSIEQHKSEVCKMEQEREKKTLFEHLGFTVGPGVEVKLKPYKQILKLLAASALFGMVIDVLTGSTVWYLVIPMTVLAVLLIKDVRRL